MHARNLPLKEWWPSAVLGSSAERSQRIFGRLHAQGVSCGLENEAKNFKPENFKQEEDPPKFRNLRSNAFSSVSGGSFTTSPLPLFEDFDRLQASTRPRSRTSIAKVLDVRGGRAAPLTPD